MNKRLKKLMTVILSFIMVFSLYLSSEIDTQAIDNGISGADDITVSSNTEFDLYDGVSAKDSEGTNLQVKVTDVTSSEDENYQYDGSNKINIGEVGKTYIINYIAYLESETDVLYTKDRTVTCVQEKATKVLSTPRADIDRTNDFKMDHLIIESGSQVIYDDSLTDKTPNENMTMSAIQKVIKSTVSVSLKDSDMSNFEEGEYVSIEVFRLSSDSDGVFTTSTTGKPLYINNVLLANAYLVTTVNGDGSTSVNCKIVFTENIKSKHDISFIARCEGTLTMVDDGDKSKIINDGNISTTIEKVPAVTPPVTNRLPIAGIYNSGKRIGSATMSGIMPRLQWEVNYFTNVDKQFSDYVNGTQSITSDVILNESLDCNQTFSVNSSYIEGLRFEVRAPLFLYNEGYTGNSWYTDNNQYAKFDLGVLADNQNLGISYIDANTMASMEAAETYVNAHAKTWTIVTERDPSTPSKDRQRLIFNMGTPGTTGLKFSDIMSAEEFADYVSLLSDNATKCANAIASNPGAGDNDNITFSGITAKKSDWVKSKKLYDDSVAYYMTQPYIYGYRFIPTSQWLDDSDSYNAIEATNSFEVKSNVGTTSDSASVKNVYNSSINAQISNGEVKLFKANSLYGNSTNKTDDSNILGGLKDIEFEVYDDSDQLIHFTEVAGKYIYSTSSSDITKLKTDAVGTIIVSQLLEGNYYFKEVSNPNGYYSHQNQKIDFNISHTSKTYVLANNEPRGVELVKVDKDDNSQKLADATFKLYSYTTDVNSGSEVTGFTKTRIDSIDYYVYDGTGTDTLTTLTDGSLRVTGLPSGKYYLQESVAPITHELSNVKHTFELTNVLVSGANATVNLGNIENKQKTIDKKVIKVWDDNSDKDGLRPSKVDVQLYANGTAQGSTVELNVGNNWTYTWDELPVYDANKNVIVYTVDEVTVPTGYTKDVAIDATNGNVTITNKHVPTLIDKKVTKVWDDNNDQDGLRPDKIMVQLKANGTAQGAEVELNATNNWTYEWATLDGNLAGIPINYTIDEVAVPAGYTKDVATDIASGDVTITNKHVPATVSKKVTKVWDDNNDQDGIRPDKIMVQLYANDVAKGASVELNATNNWTYEWTDLAQKDNGTDITYKVDEINQPLFYDKTITTNTSGDVTITNKHVPLTINKKVTKVWNDDNDQDGLRPGKIEVQLYANNVAQGVAVELNAANNWTYEWTNLAQKANGASITYTIDEITVPTGYTKAVSTNAAGDMTITNSHTPGTVNQKVTKIWDDNNNQDGIRPDKIMVQLKANGTNQGPAVELNATNNWAYEWTSLAQKENGADIVYTVDEVTVPTGYAKSISTNGDGDIIITNTHTPATVSKKVIKDWVDNNDKDGIRPDKIMVQLRANDTNQGPLVELNATNNWTYEWTGLAQKENGIDIEYTVYEPMIPSGYVNAIIKNPAGDTVIVNMHVTGTLSKKVTKVWDDNNNQDGIRPDKIMVQLKANGTDQGSPVELNETNNWTFEWIRLDQDENGKDIVYTVDEVTVPTGYTKSISTNADGDVTIKNSHTPAIVNKKVTKVWDDNNNQDGIRPSKVEVQLYANGVAQGATVELNETNNWTYEWTGLVQQVSGADVVYTVDEVTVPTGYTKAVSANANGDIIITNTHVQNNPSDTPDGEGDTPDDSGNTPNTPSDKPNTTPDTSGSKPDSSSNTTTSAVKTGDNAAVLSNLLLAGGALCALGLLYSRKKLFGK